MYKLDWFIQTNFFELSNRISRRRNKTKLVLTFKTFNEKNEVSYKVLIFLTVIIYVYFNETKKNVLFTLLLRSIVDYSSQEYLKFILNISQDKLGNPESLKK